MALKHYPKEIKADAVALYRRIRPRPTSMSPRIWGPIGRHRVSGCWTPEPMAVGASVPLGAQRPRSLT